MKSILVIGRAFPNASHGYINNDVEYLDKKANVLVLSPNQPMAPFYSTVNFNYFSNEKDLIQLAKQFKPDFIIAWLLPNHYFARMVAEALDVPFVVKLHTPDYHVLNSKKSIITKSILFIKSIFSNETQLSKTYQVSKTSLAKTAKSKNLKGIYCIPALMEAFCRYFPSEKVFELKPRIFYDKYHNENPNGERVMVLGSLVNRREGHFAFSQIISGVDGPVDWYPMPTQGCLWLDIPGLPENLHMMKYVPPAEMPAIYKKYKAMIMIGSGRFSRGLSLSVLEAQASGVTVVAPSLRPDFDEYVKNGGGFIFSDESEIPDILKKIPDASRRESGFKYASHYDIAGIEEELAKAGLFL